MSMIVQELDKHTNSITQNNSNSSSASRFNRSEVITIIIGYRESSYDRFKNYYLKRIWIHHRRDFQLVICSQFVKVIGLHLPILVLIFNSILDQCDGLSFVDSSGIEVCKRHRISMNKIFANIAARGKKQKVGFMPSTSNYLQHLLAPLIRMIDNN